VHTTATMATLFPIIVAIGAPASTLRSPIQQRPLLHGHAQSTRPAVQANLLADVLVPRGVPRDSKAIRSQAIAGVRAALRSKRDSFWEVEFPPLQQLNKLGDGSARSAREVDQVNCQFAAELSQNAGRATVLVACGSAQEAELGKRARGATIISVREAQQAVQPGKVAIIVSPSDTSHWAAAQALAESGRPSVVVNAFTNHGYGGCQHAFYLKPITAYGAVAGTVLKRHPGPYECFDAVGKLVPSVKVPIARQGRLATPDLRAAQLYCQDKFMKKKQ